ncbi:MAG: NAD(P)/FAD-dependent oxidoreductase [Succiniclasticum sp.]|nr:NAD(P)/FAD-dependent oxidoreductase [Succiniclasticum sp.]MDY2869510.1 NAD(P)/FAD-dependent oxidoreductase [Succiniclasticum sp.]MDY6303295.1 NAD(P)/FAD-dependent oxidoreductase [Succiniclasticum sp.]MDY6345742.1 NAD(P)/FAD-dependent oxidoreductase [Succiniclasticum sp.]
MKKYDVAIIGGGPAAIYAGWEFSVQYPDVSVLILEEGHPVEKRYCPLAAGKVDHCLRCVPCAIMRGFGGAGAFSDGKYNFTTEFGGWLPDYLPKKTVMDLIDYVDSINCSHGAPGETFTTKNSTIGRAALAHDLHLLNGKVRHLGTENNLQIMENIYRELKEKVDILCDTKVESFRKEEDTFYLETTAGQFTSDYLIAAPGRAGAEWFTEEGRKLGLSFTNNAVDVGVRVEVPALVFKHITDEVYEAKLQYRTKQYNDLVRTFCMNPNGYVVAENTDGIVTVNGHSYADPDLQSENTNFALLVSNKFTEPFKEPHQYGKRIASFSNLLGGGVLLQRFGDLVKGRRTNERRLAKSFTRPTLSATPGDLSLVLPKRQLDDIIEMIYALDKIAPGMANDDTLLYGVEVKFYSARMALDNHLETEIPNLFAVGDGAGITRGLSQASASGVFVAREIGARIAKSRS